jgi:hypothetical protein
VGTGRSNPGREKLKITLFDLSSIELPLRLLLPDFTRLGQGRSCMDLPEDRGEVCGVAEVEV